MKTPLLNPLNGVSQQTENKSGQIIINESNFNLNSSRNLLEDSNYQTSIFFSPEKNQQDQKKDFLNSNQDSIISSKNQSYQIEPKQVTSQLQSKQISGKSSRQFQQDSFQQCTIDEKQQNELIENIQSGYNNYIKFKGNSKFNCKISVQSPEKIKRDLSNPKHNKNTLSYSKEQNWQNLVQCDPTLKQIFLINLPITISFINKKYSQCMEPLSSQLNAQNKSKTALEQSPIKYMNNQFEKRENLQQYFNEIVLSHSRRQKSSSKDPQGKFKLNQSFIEHCNTQNISLQQLVQSRINYMKQDKSLVFFEKPTEETPIQFYNNTQLTKSLTPEKKKELENCLFQQEKGEGPKDSSLKGKGKSQSLFFNQPTFSKIQQTKYESPPNNENIDCFALEGAIQMDRSDKIDNLKRLVNKQKTIKLEFNDVTPKYFRNSIISKPSPPLEPQQDVSFSQPAQSQQSTYRKSINTVKKPALKKYSEKQLIDMIYQNDDVKNKNLKEEEDFSSKKNPIFESPSRMYKKLLEVLD